MGGHWHGGLAEPPWKLTETITSLTELVVNHQLKDGDVTARHGMCSKNRGQNCKITGLPCDVDERHHKITWTQLRKLDMSSSNGAVVWNQTEITMRTNLGASGIRTVIGTWKTVQHCRCPHLHPGRRIPSSSNRTHIETGPMLSELFNAIHRQDQLVFGDLVSCPCTIDQWFAYLIMRHSYFAQSSCRAAMQMSDLMDCCGMLLTSNWFDNSVYPIFFRNQIVLDGASLLNLFFEE